MKGRRTPRWPALPPRGLRPKLTADQVQALCRAHIVNLDAISRGEADVDILWQWVGGALTWSAIAGRLAKHAPDRFAEADAGMRDQLQVCDLVIERFLRLGRVGFSGAEYQRAKEACEWMDALAEVVDQPTASECADWGQLEIDKREAACRQREAA